jgi:hypothetical protein
MVNLRRKPWQQKRIARAIDTQVSVLLFDMVQPFVQIVHALRSAWTGFDWTRAVTDRILMRGHQHTTGSCVATPLCARQQRVLACSNMNASTITISSACALWWLERS